jgi:hypothetical protein
MILMGMAIATLGAAYMLRSGASLAARAGAAATARAGELGVIGALAALMSMLLLFLDAALANLYLSFFGLPISVFPLMVGIFGMFALTAVVRAVPWPGAASVAVGVYYLLDLLVFLAVPPLTDALVVAEHQTYRSGPPQLVVVSAVWPLSLIVAAVLLDIAARRVRRRRLTGTAASRPLLLAAVLGTILVPLLDPFFLSRGLSRVTKGGLGHHGLLLVVVVLLLALLLGAAAAWLGGRVGVDVGDSMAATGR